MISTKFGLAPRERAPQERLGVPGPALGLQDRTQGLRRGRGLRMTFAKVLVLPLEHPTVERLRIHRLALGLEALRQIASTCNCKGVVKTQMHFMPLEHLLKEHFCFNGLALTLQELREVLDVCQGAAVLGPELLRAGHDNAPAEALGLVQLILGLHVPQEPAQDFDGRGVPDAVPRTAPFQRLPVELLCLAKLAMAFQRLCQGARPEEPRRVVGAIACAQEMPETLLSMSRRTHEDLLGLFRVPDDPRLEVAVKQWKGGVLRCTGLVRSHAPRCHDGHAKAGEGGEVRLRSR
mmetsp:Transcript_146963/g.409357  ORF Transcript_146963/g.409357 Transcript_146963/m.409357 type:complete len:292 (-) Transcript_146963:651-1526(-)